MSSNSLKKISLSLAVFAIILLLYLFARDWIQSIDIAISQWVIQFRNPILDPLFLLITKLANAQFIIFFIIIAVIVMAALFKKPLRAVMYGLSIAFGNLVVNPTIKNIILRERPEESLRMVYEASYSFPSGHAFASAMIYPLIANFLIRYTALGRYPKLVYATTTILVLLIAFSRVYLGMHYFSDITAGLALGYVFYLLTRDLTDIYFNKYLFRKAV